MIWTEENYIVLRDKTVHTRIIKDKEIQQCVATEAVFSIRYCF